MRTKFSVIIAILFLWCNIISVAPTTAFAQQQTYARITDNETYFYKTPNNTADISNIYFRLEETYFVKIIEVNEQFYKANYLNITGYVLIDKVRIVNGVPNNPYPYNITFEINSVLNTKVRSSANMTTDENIVGILPDNNLTLCYIGEVEGEESIKSLGNKWYYCYYSYENFGCLIGYVYAPLTENLTPILSNTETFSSTVEDDTIDANTIPNNQQNILLIVLMCLPAVIIFILLVLPSKNKTSRSDTTGNTYNKPVIKVKKGSKKDFYEID